MILTAKERGQYGPVIEPGQDFEVPDDYFIPAWAEKKKGRKKAVDEPTDPDLSGSVI